MVLTADPSFCDAFAVAMMAKKKVASLQYRWGELDLLMSKPGRLLLVEVKARRQAGFDAWGAASLDDRKRRCLKRTFTCWLSQHADYQPYPVRMVLALVRLPLSRQQVRWLPVLDTTVGTDGF
ncbi:YraN family protein [Synechococcus sp. MIT S1220]|uniref:YraN family protein n=1 Tax=Synechococcus sp. MIT S1220 TaxID=3082549 RepID=UPI0039AF764E